MRRGVRAGLGRACRSRLRAHRGRRSTLLAPHVPPRRDGGAPAALRRQPRRGRMPADCSPRCPPSERLIEGIAWDAETSRLFASSVVGRALLVARGRLGWRDGAAAAIRAACSASPSTTPPRLLWMASGAARADAVAGDRLSRPDRARSRQFPCQVRRIACARTAARRPTSRWPRTAPSMPADPAERRDLPRLGSGRRRCDHAGARPAVCATRRAWCPSARRPAALRFRLCVWPRRRRTWPTAASPGSRSDVADDARRDRRPHRVGAAACIAIQNGTSPRRILHLTLSRDGTRIGARSA